MEPHVITRCSDCGIANRRAGSDKILRLRFVHTIFALYKFVCMYVYVVPVRNFFSLLNLISVTVCVILVLDLDDGTGHTLCTARRHASALAVRPVSHSRPILRKSGCPLVELQLPRKPASTDADQSQRFKWVKPVPTGLEPVGTGCNRLLLPNMAKTSGNMAITASAASSTLHSEFSRQKSIIFNKN